MLAFEQPLALPFDGALVQASALSWIARNNSKPGRGDTECWVLHGAPAWSDEHIDAAPEQVIARLSDAFHRATACHEVKPLFVAAHRWRYALPTVLLEEACLFDPTLAIGACGDWCAGPRVEGAFLSGSDSGGADPLSRRSFVRGRLEKQGVETNKRLERVEEIRGSIANLRIESSGH